MLEEQNVMINMININVNSTGINQSIMIASCVLRLQMEDMASTYGWQFPIF
jgi:hypothetical protein